MSRPLKTEGITEFYIKWREVTLPWSRLCSYFLFLFSLKNCFWRMLIKNIHFHGHNRISLNEIENYRFVGIRMER